MAKLWAADQTEWAMHLAKSGLSACFDQRGQQSTMQKRRMQARTQHKPSSNVIPNNLTGHLASCWPWSLLYSISQKAATVWHLMSLLFDLHFIKTLLVHTRQMPCSIYRTHVLQHITSGACTAVVLNQYAYIEAHRHLMCVYSVCWLWLHNSSKTAEEHLQCTEQAQSGHSWHSNDDDCQDLWWICQSAWCNIKAEGAYKLTRYQTDQHPKLWHANKLLSKLQHILMHAQTLYISAFCTNLSLASIFFQQGGWIMAALHCKLCTDKLLQIAKNTYVSQGWHSTCSDSWCMLTISLQLIDSAHVVHDHILVQACASGGIDEGKRKP